jgi:hypothetical protein
MTDSERQKLCDWLRHLPSYLSEDGMQAAEEIERLAESVRFWKAEAIKAGTVTIKAGYGIERLVQERKMERLVQERDSALATLKTHGIMKWIASG